VRRRCILDAHLRPARTGASGTVAAPRLESFRSPVIWSAVRALWKHFSQKCICVSPVMLSKKTNRARLEIDPESDFVLEFDEAAELVELLRVLVTAERGEHPREVALRGDCRP
jgi:hypothetical protein